MEKKIVPRAAEVYCSSYIILDATTTVFIIVVFRRARAFRTDVAKKTKRKAIKNHRKYGTQKQSYTCTVPSGNRGMRRGCVIGT